MLPTESPGFFTAFPSFHRVIARPRIVQNLLFALFYSIHQNTNFEKTEKQAVMPNAISRMSIIEQKANSAQKRGRTPRDLSLKRKIVNRMIENFSYIIKNFTPF
ncbi:MAG: hypothetical protein ACLRUN_12545 [Christensenellales bacterium]